VPTAGRRFYRTVGVSEEAGGFAIRLDDRPVRTPAGRSLVVPSRALAQAIAAEWEAQGDKLQPATMPMLQLANAAIDRILPDPAAVVAQLAGYAETDLICHWAPEPAELVARQRRLWQPLLDWAALTLDAALKPVTGVIAQSQPAAALEALQAAVAALDPFRLAALYILTTATGSLVIGLGVLQGRLDVAAAWEAAQVDELFQIERWGEDSEAAGRRASLRADLETAARYLALLDG
jgi:chaperone required for assembly of F1-ATPase